MTSPALFRFSRLNLNVFVLSAATWFSFILGFGAPAPREINQLVFFAAGASILSVWILHILEYFHSPRVLPRKSDLLLIAVALPVAGVIQYGVNHAIYGSVSISLRHIWLATPLLAIGLFGAHFLLEMHWLRLGRHKRIVLDLLPQEQTEFLSIFNCDPMAKYIEFMTAAELKESLLQQKADEIDQIIISRGAARDFRDDAYLARAHLQGIPIIDRRERIADLTGRIMLLDSDSWSFVLTATKQTPLLRAYSQAKLILEPVLALLLAVLLWPLMLVVALLIKLDSPGPVFYRQLRTGYMGKPFKLFKFRSMRADSEVNGPQWAKSADDRITPIGKFLRGTRIDELPQLWNVMRGEMSFLGPRPERPEFYVKLKDSIPLFSMRTIIRPGVTGWAQVCQGYVASVEESKTKLEFDLYYIKHVSLRLDLIILIKTILVALMGSERARTMMVFSDETVVAPSVTSNVPAFTQES